MSKSKVILLFFGLLIFFCFLFFLTLNYETNDDPLMMFISSGALTQTPDEHLQCINILIGYLFKGLYQASPGINWYSLFLLSVHFVSILVFLLTVLYKQKVSAVEMLFFIFILFCGYEALFLVKLQFTATSFICGFAAVFILLSQFSNTVKLSVFTILFVIAFLLRKEVFLPILAFASVAFLITWQKKEMSVKHIAAVLAASVAMFVFSQWANDHDDEYRTSQYYEFHRATDILCNNPIDTGNNVISKYNWSQNDISLLNFWFWADDSVFSHEKIVAFSKEVKTSRNLKQTMQRFSTFLNDERFTLLIICISAVGVLFMVNKKEDEMLVILNIIAAFSLIMYLVITIRVPKRVSTPIMFYVAMVNIYLIVLQNYKIRLKRILLGFLALICVYKLWCVYDLSEKNKSNLQLFSQSVAQINKYPDDIFIIVSTGFPVENMPVYQNTQDLIKNRNLIFTGWFIDMPSYNDILAANNLKNLCRDIIGKKNIVFLNRQERFREILTTYYKEHYHVSVSFTPYEPPLQYMQAYRIHFGQPADSSGIQQPPTP